MTTTQSSRVWKKHFHKIVSSPISANIGPTSTVAPGSPRWVLHVRTFYSKKVNFLYDNRIAESKGNQNISFHTFLPSVHLFRFNFFLQLLENLGCDLDSSLPQQALLLHLSQGRKNFTKKCFQKHIYVFTVYLNLLGVSGHITNNMSQQQNQTMHKR